MEQRGYYKGLPRQVTTSCLPGKKTTKELPGVYQLLLFFIISLSFVLSPLLGEIIVKQDRNGNIIVSNTPYTPPKTHFKKPSSLPTYPGENNAVPEKYRSKIKQLAAKYQVKEKLIIAVIRAESGFQPHAVSRKGAVGLMQLMKSTAIKYGVRNRYDAHQNMEGGVRHLKFLQKKYQYDLSLVLAAYNAGEDAVKKYNGIPPYRETKTYIKRVMSYMGLNSSGYLGNARKTKIYKIIKPNGEVLITDTLPAKVKGTVISLN